MIKSISMKLLICSIFIIILSTSFSVSSYALSDIFGKGKGFLEAGNDISDTINTQALETTSDIIYNTLLAIAIMVAIVVAMVLGIQFMAASADEKAKVKEALMPFVVGCIVVFGSFTIWKVVVNIGNDAEDSVVAHSISSEYSSIEEVTKDAHGIIDGTLDIGSLSNEKIKDLYSSQYVGDDIRGKMRKDSAQDVEMTLEEAINDLSEYKRKIYNEAKARGLLKDNGIDLK